MTIFYLEQTDPSQLNSKSTEQALTTKAIQRDKARLSQQYYLSVGQAWQWNDKRDWSLTQWQDYAERPELELYIAYKDEQAVGYFELEKQAEQQVEIAYFGLLPEACNSGLGGALLSLCLQQAWASQTRRVWVHTCDLDHPHALANYQARGMTLYKTELETKDL